MHDTPRGLRIMRSGQSIERVQTRNNDIHLLSHGDGTEVWRQVIQPGGRFTIAPAEAWDALEFIYILDGRLHSESVGFDAEFGPGDSISVHHLQDAVRFTAKSTVTILYVCSQPTFHQVSRLIHELMEMAERVEDKDGYTAEHCRRIKDLSLSTAEKLGFSPMQTLLLGYAAFLHDLGKAKIPDEILGKPAPLTKQEWEIMRMHPIYGREILDETILRGAGVMVEQHHERLDGSGYPYGLRHDQILIESQIIAVVDTYDAMTTDRPYRRALPKQLALDEIEKGLGTLWSTEVGRTFIRMMQNEDETD